MKRYDARFSFERKREAEWRNEHKAGGFRCSHCKRFVIINDLMGTANRNHCDRCLWSRHVDEATGDRKAACQAGMKPIGITLKHEGFGRMGEIMLVQLCSTCGKISINRVARDDNENEILAVFERSSELDETTSSRLSRAGINLLTGTDCNLLHRQLFGKPWG